jgi:hypothetical protein
MLEIIRERSWRDIPYIDFEDETFHEASALSISMSIQIRIKLKLLKCRKEKMNFTAEGARVGQPNC